MEDMLASVDKRKPDMQVAGAAWAEAGYATDECALGAYAARQSATGMAACWYLARFVDLRFEFDGELGPIESAITELGHRSGSTFLERILDLRWELGPGNRMNGAFKTVVIDAFAEIALRSGTANIFLPIEACATVQMRETMAMERLQRAWNRVNRQSVVTGDATMESDIGPAGAQDNPPSVMTAQERPAFTIEMDPTTPIRAPSTKPAQSTEAIIVPLDEIGDIKSEKGKELAIQFNSLLRPVPLVGQTHEETVKSVLDSEYPWASELIDEVADYLALSRRSNRNFFWLRPTLLVGEPGIGKTRFARRIAEICGVPHRTISAAGSSDDKVIRGLARSWHGHQASLPAQVIARHKVGNPLICIDEIDKTVTESRNGNMTDTLLTFLERDTRKRYFDECLLGHLDLRYVTWVLTANSLDGLPDPLLNRLEIFFVPSPAPEHFDVLLPNIRKDFEREWGLQLGQSPDLRPADLETLRREFREDLSVRRLATNFEKVMARSARGRSWEGPKNRNGKHAIGFN
jgi:hypothetical protein